MNVQVFQNIMMNAWKTEHVTCTLLELGLFLFFFTFDVEVDEYRVLDSGPWLLTNHLLLLKP